MADSNRIKLAFAPETTFNTHPSSSGDWTELRIQSESLKQDLSVASSSEIRSYRDIPALNKTDRSVSGSVSQSLYYDDNATSALIRYAIGSGAWTTEATVTSSGTVATTQATRLFTKAASWTNTPSAGSWVYISDSSNSATNGFHQVASSPTPTSTAFAVNSAIGASEASASLTIVELSEVTNGNDLTTMSIQRDYTDLSSVGEYFTGCAIDGLSLDASGQDTVKFNSDWVGVTAMSDGASESIDNDASTSAEMTSIDGVQWVREGTGAGNVAGVDVLGFGFQIANGIRKQYKLGTFGADGMSVGDFTVTGTMQVYFENATLFDKFLNQTATGLSIAISDEATSQGNAFIFDFPNVRFTDGQRVAGGRNQDIIADLSWQAIYNGSTHTMKVARIASA